MELSGAFTVLSFESEVQEQHIAVGIIEQIGHKSVSYTVAFRVVAIYAAEQLIAVPFQPIADAIGICAVKRLILLHKSEDPIKTGILFFTDIIKTSLQLSLSSAGNTSGEPTIIAEVTVLVEVHEQFTAVIESNVSIGHDEFRPAAGLLKISAVVGPDIDPENIHIAESSLIAPDEILNILFIHLLVVCC